MTSRAAATRYARALFDVAKVDGSDLDTVARELSDAAAFISGNEALSRVLANPAIPAARKRAVVEQLLAINPVTPVLSRVLLLLAERDRLALLPDVAAGFESRLMDHYQVVRAEVTTATALPADRVEALERGLAQVTGRRVQLAVRIDPDIVGGAVARIGSTVYDGSVVTQLQKLKQQLIEAEI
jgi:F-type H+-transporting ATPase subunit delta